MSIIHLINKKLDEKFGKAQLKLRRGRGYYYLSGPMSEGLFSTSIYTFRASDLTLEQWENEIETLLKDRSIAHV